MKNQPYKEHLQRVSKFVEIIINNIVEEKGSSLTNLYNCKIIEDDEDLIVVNNYDFDLNHDVYLNNKEVRLLKDLIIQQYPVFKKMPDVISDIIRKEFNLFVPVKKVMNNKPFGQIVKKKVINYNNLKKQSYVTTTIRRRMNLKSAKFKI